MTDRKSKIRPEGKERLQKVMAAAGIASRRKCQELILDGFVTVNDQRVDSLPVFVNPEKDIIEVKGQRIRPAKKVYCLLNKPAGVICTSSDPQGRPRAIDLIDSSVRIVCAGRLDADTTGAIILTNDLEMVNRLTHPRYELAKTYLVRVKGRIDGASIEKLKKGLWFSEGKTAASAVKILKRNYTESTLQITIRQGLNRQIRRMLARVGFKVKTLHRTHIGNINIKGLAIGRYRILSAGQIAYLKKTTGLLRRPDRFQRSRQ